MVYRGITSRQTSQPIRFVPLRQIPRVARSMVVKLEDYRFYQHAGVDLGALRDAWMVNSSIGRTVSGGSTIPMQLARNLFLTPRKTYFRKYVEAIIALEMDLVMPKDRILELYLNSIEWAGDFRHRRRLRALLQERRRGASAWTRCGAWSRSSPTRSVST